MNSPLNPETDKELDDWILELVHQGSMIPRGKTVAASMFPEAKQALIRLLVKERLVELKHTNRWTLNANLNRASLAKWQRHYGDRIAELERTLDD